MLSQKLCCWLVVIAGFATSGVSHADATTKFKLVSAKVVDEGKAIHKTYTVNGPINVNYEYLADEMGAFGHVLGLRIIASRPGLIPLSLEDDYIYAGGDNNSVVKSFGIQDNPRGECKYYGSAVVRVSKITKYEPEFPSGSDTDMVISKVISFTPPKLKCE